MMRRHTINDIADSTGYSVATVSRVLNGTGSFSRKAAQVITEAAERLNYRQDLPSAPKGGLIYAVIPTITNSFYAEVLRGMDDCAEKNNFSLVISQTRNNSNYSLKLKELASSGLVNGFITLEHRASIGPLFGQLPPHIPVVQCCEYDETLPYPYISVNNSLAAQNVITYLANIGRRKIALINSTIDTLYAVEREKGYVSALEALGLPVRNEWRCHLPAIEFNLAYSIALKLLSSPDRPDAMFCVSDIYAVAAVRAAQDLKLSIPGDIAIVGFDNTDISVMSNPPLTTVSQPRYQLGYTACHMLVRLIKNSAVIPDSTLMDTELVVRGSA